MLKNVLFHPSQMLFVRWPRAHSIQKVERVVVCGEVGGLWSHLGIPSSGSSHLHSSCQSSRQVRRPLVVYCPSGKPYLRGLHPSCRRTYESLHCPCRRSSEVERSLMVRWVVGSILHGVDPLSYFSFQPVLHD